MTDTNKLAADLWRATFAHDGPDIVPRGHADPLVTAAREAIAGFDRLRRQLAESRAEIAALTREPTETAEALECLRRHVTEAIVLIRRGQVAADPRRAGLLDEPGAMEPFCAGMSAEGLGQYLRVIAPSLVLVQGYEAFRRQIDSLTRENVELREQVASHEQPEPPSSARTRHCFAEAAAEGLRACESRDFATADLEQAAAELDEAMAIVTGGAVRLLCWRPSASSRT